MHVSRVDVVQRLRSVVGLDHLDRLPVLDQHAAQAQANLGELLGVGRPQ